MRRLFAVVLFLSGTLSVAWGDAPVFRFNASTQLPVAPPPALFLRQWVVAGPFPIERSEDEAAREAALRREPLDVAALATIDGATPWKPLAINENQPQLDLLSQLQPNTFTVAYVATFLFAEQACERTLLLGSDDGVVVWLNGRRVHEHYVVRGCVPDDDRIPIALNAGVNLLILKVTQLEGGWSFCARVDDNSGLATGTKSSRDRAADLPVPEELLSMVKARLVAGPYVQNTGQRRATLFWQTDVPSEGSLTLYTPQGTFVAAATQARTLHEVAITGLDPDTAYPYQVRVWNPHSPTHLAQPAGGQFHTFPEQFRPVKLLVYGDTRTHPERHAMVINRMCVERDVDCVLHSGDIVGSGNELSLWIPELFEPAGPLMRDRAMFFALGNHENNSPNYFTYVDLPFPAGAESRPDRERWYSFDVGAVHIAVLDSNWDYGPGSAQHTWLCDDLERHRRTPWKIVLSHHPTFSSGPHGRLAADGRPGEVPMRTAQDVFPGLAREYDVQLFIAGHDHGYERTVLDGVQYIVSGGGGAPSYRKTGDAMRQNPHSILHSAVLHFCVLTADSSRLSWMAKDELGMVFDVFHLTR